MIVWYGERGVVNAMVAHLLAQNAGASLLRSISWASGNAPPWIERVTLVTYVVEVGLAEFGNPDLILVCTVAGDPKPYCVFVEAKVVPYLASALSNKLGMAMPKYNSACNGQLALKYRFARALGDWDGRSTQIAEPKAIHENYRVAGASGGLSDPKPRPRHLEKRQILCGIMKPLGLDGLPLDHCCFVALTWDREPFFKVASDLLPRFLDEDGVDRFGEMSAQVGWLGYQKLSEIPGLAEAVTPALNLMVGSVEPTDVDLTTATWTELRTQRIGQMSEGIQQLVRQLEGVAVESFGRESVLFYTGSISVKFARIEAKIAPQRGGGEEFILLGVRPEWPLGAWSGIDVVGFKIMGQPFATVRLPPAPADALRIAQSVFSGLREARGDGPESSQSDTRAEV